MVSHCSFGLAMVEAQFREFSGSTANSSDTAVIVDGAKAVLPTLKELGDKKAHGIVSARKRAMVFCRVAGLVMMTGRVWQVG